MSPWNLSTVIVPGYHWLFGKCWLMRRKHVLPGENGGEIADDEFKFNFVNENWLVSKFFHWSMFLGCDLWKYINDLNNGLTSIGFGLYHGLHKANGFCFKEHRLSIYLSIHPSVHLRLFSRSNFKYISCIFGLVFCWKMNKMLLIQDWLWQFWCLLSCGILEFCALFWLEAG